MLSPARLVRSAGCEGQLSTSLIKDLALFFVSLMWIEHEGPVVRGGQRIHPHS